MSVSERKVNRKVLLTGATGYIGAHLCEAFCKMGWDVHVLVRKNPGNEQVRRITNGVTAHDFDGDLEQLFQIMSHVMPDAVFHLASIAAIEHQPSDLEPLVSSNILLGLQLLEAMHHTGVSCFINTGTFWQYYGAEAYNPVNLYAATKQAFQDILCYYVEARLIHATTLILFDVYGPGDQRGKLFKQLDDAYQEKQTLRMSPGNQELDFVYIDDVAQAYIWAAQLLWSNDPVSVGQQYAVSSNRPISLRSAVDTYLRVTGRKINLEWGERPYRFRQVMKLWKGPRLPGWKPTVDLEEGIRRLNQESSINHFEINDRY